MIKVENVTFKYNNNENAILDNLSFSVKEGEIIAIVGKNGSGKSTLGKLISGITKLKHGNIIIDNFNISNNKQILKKVGIVFQNPENQIIFNNIYDELAFLLKSLDKSEIDKRINFALEQVDMLKFKHSDLYHLSLGQKQRIMIAEILAKNPKYIIFDESTSMIDSTGKEAIYNIIKKLKSNGYSIICITNLADEMLIADRTLILHDGKIAYEIKKEELIKNANILEKFDIKIPVLLELLVKLKENYIDLNIKDFSIDEIVKNLKGISNNDRCN